MMYKIYTKYSAKAHLTISTILQRTSVPLIRPMWGCDSSLVQPTD